MKENGIKFKLDLGDREVEISGEITEDNTITRMGKPVLCNCTGNTPETATPFQFDGFKVYCPECGKFSEDITTFTDYQDYELENIHLTYFATDYITLQELYKVSYTLPYEKWQLIEDLFMKLTPDDVDFGAFEPKFVGWVTSNPEAVEERLNVKPELRVNYIRNLKEKEYSKKLEEKEKLEKVLEGILEVFSVVETPESPDGMFTVEGSTVMNPLNPWNEYGGGEKFIINLEYIWYIRNNSRDTDNHEFNNIKIKGSYGAIGKRVPYDEDLANMILGLKDYLK